MPYRELTAQEITKEVLLKLRIKGYTVWRQNNLTWGRRKNIVKHAVSDIIGYSDKGLFVACEVKKIGDVFSDEQKEFLNGIGKRGGLAFWATQKGANVEIYVFNQGEKLERSVATKAK